MNPTLQETKNIDSVIKLRVLLYRGIHPPLQVRPEHFAISSGDDRIFEDAPCFLIGEALCLLLKCRRDRKIEAHRHDVELYVNRQPDR